MKKLCLYLSMLLPMTTMAQKGDWYTWCTGTNPVTHIIIGDDEMVIDRTDPSSRQGGINGRMNKSEPAEHLSIEKKVTKGDRVYLIFQSFDGLYFIATIQRTNSSDSLRMYCADGVEDGYKSLGEAIIAIPKDTGRDFYITLFKQKVLDAEKRKPSVSKISEQEFGTALQTFNDWMDHFWQDRGYGRYEPYHSFMNLIYGNAWANAVGDKYSKLSLIAKELRVPVNNYKSNTTIKRLLESAGFLKEEDTQ